MLPQNWGLGGLKEPSLRCQYFQVLNLPAVSILGDFEFMLPQNWGLGGLKNLPELTIFPTVKFASNILEEAPNGWVVIRWRQDKPTPLPLPGGELNPQSRLGYLLSEIA